MSRFCGFHNILDVEYGFCKKISSVYSFLWHSSCREVKFVEAVTVFRLLRSRIKWGCSVVGKLPVTLLIT